jgi:hypothetical protein
MAIAEGGDVSVMRHGEAEKDTELKVAIENKKTADSTFDESSPPLPFYRPALSSENPDQHDV